MLRFQFITRDFENRLAELEEAGKYTVSIYNDAQNADGTYYWIYVNNGRGPVRPVNAKVLHWKDASGKDVFATYAKGVPPTHILENSLAAIRTVQIEGDFRELSPETIHNFVDATAKQLVKEMQDRTPVKTGALKAGYRIGEEKENA